MIVPKFKNPDDRYDRYEAWRRRYCCDRKWSPKNSRVDLVTSIVMVATFPDFYYGWQSLGLTLYAADEDPTALLCLRRAYEVEPSKYGTASDYAEKQLRLKYRRKHRQFCKNYLKRYPQAADVMASLAESYWMNGNNQAAEAWLNQAIAEISEDTKSDVTSMEEFLRPKLEEAKKDGTFQSEKRSHYLYQYDAVTIAPDLTGPWKELAAKWLDFYESESVKSLSIDKRFIASLGLITVAPRDHFGWQECANALMSLGEPYAAMECFWRASRQAPSNRALMLNAASLMFNLLGPKTSQKFLSSKVKQYPHLREEWRVSPGGQHAPDDDEFSAQLTRIFAAPNNPS